VNLFANILNFKPRIEFSILVHVILVFGVGFSLAVTPANYPGSYTGQEGTGGAGGSNVLPDELQGVSIDENLGAQLPLDASFKDEAGKTVVLRQYLQSGKPLLINFAYFRCPMLCNLVMKGMLDAMKVLPWTPGTEYQVLTIGIDPREGPTEANAKKETHIAELNKPGSELGWHFLTGEESQIRSVADQVGFHYRYDVKQDQYAHAAGIFTVSAQGKVMRYLYGIDFKPIDLRLALLDAAKGRSLSLGDRFVTFCYRYDANAKGYVLFAKDFMRDGGYVVLLGLTAFLGYFWRKELKRKAPASHLTQPVA
jgi:protein SCO1